MARRTLADLYDEARTYLDTDDLNFPDDLCRLLLRRVWFQAVNMEPEWRFLRHDGTVDVLAHDDLVPLTFTIPSLGGVQREAARVDWLRWSVNGALLRPVTLLDGARVWQDTYGTPEGYSDYADAQVRSIRLWPSANTDGTLTAGLIIKPDFPSTDEGVMVDLPEEFDDALLQALLAEMYMREEDADLYQFQRSMFMEQMGSIRQRWRPSIQDRLVMAGEAYRYYRHPHRPKLAGSGWPA